MREKRIQLGKNIKAERTRMGLTIEEVSQKLGITSRQYSNYESGHRIDGITLFQLSKILNCNINAFYFKINSTESEMK